MISFWKSATTSFSSSFRNTTKAHDADQNTHYDSPVLKVLTEMRGTKSNRPVNADVLKTGLSSRTISSVSSRGSSDFSSEQRMQAIGSSPQEVPSDSLKSFFPTIRKLSLRYSKRCPDLRRGHDCPKLSNEEFCSSERGEAFIQFSDLSLYEIVGEGTFGTVYRARLKKNGALVALKILKPKSSFVKSVPANELSSTYRSIQKSFISEINLLGSVGDHPNIISLYGQSQDQRMCVLEIACCDLFQLVRAARRSLPLAIAHSIAHGVLSGVAHLQQIGIIHQDLKSSNILLDEHGQAKVCDFGLAAKMKGKAAVKVDREIITLWYRAPELLMGCASYDTRVDDWAVGCILLELLIGGVAFPGNPSDTCACDCRRHLNFNRDQLGRVFKLLGTPTVAAADMACQPHFALWPSVPPRLSEFIADRCADRAAPSSPTAAPSAAASLPAWTAAITALLTINRGARISCAAALKLPLFQHSPLLRPAAPLPPKRVSSAGSSPSPRSSAAHFFQPFAGPALRFRKAPRPPPRSPRDGGPQPGASAAAQLLRALKGDTAQEGPERLPLKS